MKIPLLDLKYQYASIRNEILEAVAKVCDSQHYILGESVSELEKSIASYCDSKYAVGVSSGTDALLIALMIEGIGPGDEVITTDFSFFTTAGTIARVGAKPVFVDIDAKTFNIDINKIEEKITNKTKAIIPVHLFGQACEIEKLCKLADLYDLKIIEDCAQSIGAKYIKHSVGSFGDYGCFSFFPSKNLGCFGDGGIVITNNKEKYNLLKSFRRHGSSAENKYKHNFIGGNFRLDEIQAAILNVKLKKLNNWIEERRINAFEYSKNLFTVEEIILPNVFHHTYNQYCIVLEKHDRDALRAFLSENGIQTEVYYPIPLHRQPCFKYLGYKNSDFSVTTKISNKILALPIYPGLKVSEICYITEKIKKFIKKSW